MSVELVGDGLVAYYTYTAKMKEAPSGQLEGFGEITFDCRKGNSCIYGSGFYKDTQLKDSVDFTLHRLCGDYERLLSENPYSLIERYVQEPTKFRCSNEGN